MRRVVHHHELPCGVDGVGGEVYLPAVDAMPGRTGRVEGERSHTVESEHSERQESRPAIRRKRHMGRRKSSEEVVLGGSDRPFCRVGAVLEGRNMLKGDILGV